MIDLLDGDDPLIGKKGDPLGYKPWFPACRPCGHCPACGGGDRLLPSYIFPRTLPTLGSAGEALFV